MKTPAAILTEVFASMLCLDDVPDADAGKVLKAALRNHFRDVPVDYDAFPVHARIFLHGLVASMQEAKRAYEERCEKNRARQARYRAALRARGVAVFDPEEEDEAAPKPSGDSALSPSVTRDNALQTATGRDTALPASSGVGGGCKRIKKDPGPKKADDTGARMRARPPGASAYVHVLNPSGRDPVDLAIAATGERVDDEDARRCWGAYLRRLGLDEFLEVLHAFEVDAQTGTMRNPAAVLNDRMAAAVFSRASAPLMVEEPELSTGRRVINRPRGSREAPPGRGPVGEADGLPPHTAGPGGARD